MPDNDQLAAVLAEMDTDLAQWRSACTGSVAPKRGPGRPPKALIALREAAGGDMGKAQADVLAALRQEVASLREQMATRRSAPQPATAVRGQGRPKCELDLDRVKELAALGLSHRHAAPLLNVNLRTFDQHLADDADVREAWDAGRAEAVEKHARRLETLAENGDLGAIIFYLKTRGGFTVPCDPVASVTVNLGSQPAPVSTAHADQLLANQRRYLSRRRSVAKQPSRDEPAQSVRSVVRPQAVAGPCPGHARLAGSSRTPPTCRTARRGGLPSRR